MWEGQEEEEMREGQAATLGVSSATFAKWRSVEASSPDASSTPARKARGQADPVLRPRAHTLIFSSAFIFSASSTAFIFSAFTRLIATGTPGRGKRHCHSLPHMTWSRPVGLMAHKANLNHFNWVARFCSFLSRHFLHMASSSESDM